MTATAIVFLSLSLLLLLWGGLAASAMFLRARPEPPEYPSGGEDDHRPDEAPAIRDT